MVAVENAWALSRSAFRPREIFIRDEGRFRYIPLSTLLQLLIVALSLVLVVSTAAALLGPRLLGDEASRKAAALEEARAGYAELLQSLDRLAEGLDPQTAALVREHMRREAAQYGLAFPGRARDGAWSALLARLGSHAEGDRVALGEVNDKLLKRALLAEQQAAELANQQRDLLVKAGESAAQLRLSEARSRRSEQAADALRGRIVLLETGLTGSAQRGDLLALRLGEARSELGRERQRTELAVADRLALTSEIARLQGQVESYRYAQTSWLVALAGRTQDSIALVESAVAMTGVDLDKLLGRASRELRGAVGGPFLTASVEAGDLPQGVDALANDVGVQVERWEALKRVVRALPISAPLDRFEIASRFGHRTDPFNGRKAMHAGLDFNAPVKTPVLSTAPGRVVFAGWKGEYGRMVEIDHGYGIHTRYAHLAHISVSRGDELGHRAEIGLLGSSGRSTGPHLHYEVLVDGRPMNPLKFMEAARHVFKS